MGIAGLIVGALGIGGICYGMKEQNNTGIFGGITAVVMAVILIAVAGARILGPAEVGVVTRFGSPTREITAGLNFVNPFTDSVSKMDYLVHGTQQTDEVYTKDGVAVTVESTVQWQVEPGKATYILQTFGNVGNAESKMKPRLAQGIRNVCSSRSAMDMITDRGAFEADYSTATSKLGEGLGLQINTVTITNLTLPESLEKQLTAAQEAEGKQREIEQTAANELLVVEKENKIRVANAEAERQVAEKEKAAQILRGEGEAEYARLLGQAADSVGGSQTYVRLKELETQQHIADVYTERWNGAFPDTVMTNGGESGILFNIPGFNTSKSSP